MITTNFLDVGHVILLPIIICYRPLFPIFRFLIKWLIEYLDIECLDEAFMDENRAWYR